MQCSFVMKSDVECCRLDDTVAHAAQRMAARNIGFVPIRERSGNVVGTLTDRDIVLRAVAVGLDPATTPIADIYTHDVVACSPEDDLTIAEALMSRHKKSRILCIDAENHLAGIISLSDVAIAETGRRASALLRSISQRESHN